MSTQRRRRPLSDDDDPPHKKQKMNPINMSVTPPPIPSTPPLEEHDEEEKAEETEHAIHSDKATPKQEREYNTGHGLGHLTSGPKPGWFLSKDLIINQLQAIQEKGSIPKDLQRQMEEYYERKQIMDKHIQNRTNQKKQPQIQPIVTVKNGSDSLQQNGDEFETEEAWNCNVIICFFCSIIFIIFIYALNMRFGVETNNMTYCDTDLCKSCLYPLNKGEIDKTCLVCPSFAKCEHGVAKCNDDNDKLHPFKGCLPFIQYKKQINGEILYTQIYDLLKQRRRRHLNCDKSIKYALSENEMRHIFERDKRNLGMNKSELSEAMYELFDNILLEEFAHELILNISSVNKTYYANLAEWELKSSKNCTKMNVLLMAKTYGLELSVTVLCLAAFFVSWRQIIIMYL